MKKIAVLAVVALFLGGCSLKMVAFPLNRFNVPMGIPEQGWRLCWDAVEEQLQTIRNQQVPRQPLSVEEIECLRAGLMSMCGEGINANEGIRDRLYQVREVKMSPSYFSEYMEKQEDKCEEDGNQTELVERILEKAKRTFNAAAVCQ